MRPRPTPTLFPYTTLFRSYDVSRLRDAIAANLETERRGSQAGWPIGNAYVPRPHPPTSERRRCLLAIRPVSRDRKSTRLNSSHPSISYAVFCLNKKKHILD